MKAAALHRLPSRLRRGAAVPRLAATTAAGCLLALSFPVLSCASRTATPAPPAPKASASTPEAAPPAAATARRAEPPAAPAPAAAAATSPAAMYLNDEAALGRAAQVFRAVCTGYCHSTQAIPRESPDLFDCQWLHGGSDQEIFHTITTGVPDTPMQSFAGKLPDDEIWKIVAYLRSKSRCTE